MSPKIQRLIDRIWPVALLVMVVVVPLEVYNTYRKQKEAK